MSTRPKILIEIERELGIAERSLIKQHREIRQFVRTEHTKKDNLDKQDEVAKSEEKVAALLESLLENKNVSVEFRVQANELCDRCRALNEYSRDMFAALDRDFYARQSAEEKKSISIAEAGLILAATFGMANLANIGAARHHVTVDQGAAAGFALSSSFVFRKRIGRAIRGGIGGVRNAPALLRKGAVAVYYSPPVMDSRIGVRLALQASANAINVRVIRTAARTKNLAAKIKLMGSKP